MAFKPSLLVKLQPSTLFTDPATIPAVQPQTLAPQFWLYQSDGDSLATVTTSNYFRYFGNDRNQLLYNNGQSFQVGDIIWAVCNDDNAWVQITGLDPITTSVQVADPASVNTAAIQDLAVTNPKLAADAVTNVKVAAGAAIAFSKLASLPSAQILVGSAGNVPTAVAVTGDVTISNLGVTAITAGAVVNADVNAAAAIDFSKLAPLASANILVGSAGNVATSVAMTGDVAIDNAGATTIQAGAIDLGMLSAGITPSHIVKFAGQPTTVGGAAAEAFAIPGVLATDLAFVQIVDDGTANVTALQAACTVDTLTVTFSANPGADCIFNYQILRAAA